MKILIAIDMQNDFIDGTLGSEQAQAIVPNVVDKIKEYGERGDLVLLTKDTHSENYMDTQEGSFLPIPHCIKGTNGWKINKEVREAWNKYTVLKYENVPRNVSRSTILKETFGSVILAEEVQRICDNFYYEGEPAEKLEIEGIELVGLDLDICVISNALMLKAYFPEMPITVDVSCCAASSPEGYASALDILKTCQFIIKGDDIND